MTITHCPRGRIHPDLCHICTVANNAEDRERRKGCEIADLERKVEHARAVAACSIGQPDRAENVAYREECEAELRAARERAELT